jgi:hypothetical protein
MALNPSGVSIESWVQLAPGVTMRHETDVLNQQTMLCFGPGDEYVLILDRENLRQVVALANKALAELDAPRLDQAG